MVMDVPRLETTRLRLRGFRMADLDQLASIYGDSEVMRYIGLGLPMSREAASERLTAMIFRWETRRIPIWAVEQKDSGELIGRCGFSPYLETDQIELSYTFARRRWSHGFASEAAQACLNFAQDRFAWPSVLARSHPENFASRRVLEKLGFRFHRLELEHRGGPAIFYLLEMRTNSPARAIADVENQNRVTPDAQPQ